jgi:hypothetical protein
VNVAQNQVKAYVNGLELPLQVFNGTDTLSGTLIPANNLFLRTKDWWMKCVN